MNTQRIEQCISMMQRAKNLYMPCWQGTFKFPARTEEELHSCGNTACFGGYLAVSKHFQDAGGTVDLDCGSPVFQEHESAAAVAKYLEIPRSLADALVHGIVYFEDTFLPKSADVYYDLFGVKFPDVKPEHVIKLLRIILKGKVA